MTNPNPSPELRIHIAACPFCGSTTGAEPIKDNRKLWAVRCGCGLHGTWNTRRYGAIESWNDRAHRHHMAALKQSLSQALPAPGEVELAGHVRGIAQVIRAFPNDEAWGGPDMAQQAAAILDRAVEALAAVAAANDEGVARDLLRGSFDSAFENAKSWYTEDAAVEAMVQFAGTVGEAAAQVADRQAASCQREADSRLPGPEKDAWQRAAEEIAMTAAAIRLLSQEGGK